MPDTTTDRTMQDFLDMTWRNCRAVNADYRWTLEDISMDARYGATAYALGYTGTFSFMVDMRRQAQRGVLSASQAKGVMNCMMAEVRRERALAAPPVVVDMSAIMTLFRRAGTHLQRPRVTLSGVTLKLSTRGQFPGTIGLTSGQWPNSVWLGRIGVDGTLTRGRNMTDDVLTLIQELAADPVAAAQRYASLTGNCCFCNLRLTDERSTQAGYGPICAGHYGLPWGNGTTRNESTEAMEFATGTAPVQRLRTSRLQAIGEAILNNQVQTPEGFTYQPGVAPATMRRRTPQVPALPGMTPLGMQAITLEAGVDFGPTIHMCHECPAFAICQEQGQCNGGVVA